MKRAPIMFLLALMLVGQTYAAEVSLAYAEPQSRTLGINLEGEIVPGDADKLRNFLRSNWEKVGFGNVWLHSKGGDVVEAMKIGRFIRKLRLRTSTGNYNHFTGERTCYVKLAKPDNCICASACFLVFSGGAYWTGSNFALHRPFIAMSAAAALSDIQREDSQKAGMLIVRKYLEEMEVPTFYIDKIMAHNSQQAYFVTFDDVHNESHRLSGYPPSIEEITLTGCKTDKGFTKEQFDVWASLLKKGERRTPEENRLFNKLQDLDDKRQSGIACQGDAFRQLQDDAFRRELFKREF